MRCKDQWGICWVGLLVCVLAALACNFPTVDVTPMPGATPSPPSLSTTLTFLPTSVTRLPTATIQLPYEDVSPIFVGICFNFLQTLAGQTVVLNSSAELAAFYDRVDISKQCRDAVARHEFDFSARQIIGTVAAGKGCQIEVRYNRIDMDANARQRRIVFQTTPVGDCDYGLVRPLWLAMQRPPDGYTTLIQLSGTS